VQSGCHAGSPKPKGYNPTPSDSGCPPTNLTCTVPLPLTNAGRDSYQHPGKVKSAPVTARRSPTTGSRNLGRDLRNKAKQAWDWLLTGGKTIADLFSGGLSLFSGGLSLFSGGLDLLQGGVDVALGGGISALCGQSFTAGTKVLLASGATIPIADLKPGDKVLATNVKTGKTQAETVGAVLVHHDTDLYNLKVKKGDRTAVIRTTANHLFWDTTTGRWVKASALHRGDHLRTPSGSIATAAGGYTPRQDTGWMWDLTIPGDHDFYIDTFATSLLVHNYDCPIANSKEDVNGGTYKTRDQALGAAENDQKDYRYGNVRTRIRLGCKPTNCHVHLDVFNKHGELLKTIHYTYHQR
jgi:hypothetical protein